MLGMHTTGGMLTIWYLAKFSTFALQLTAASNVNHVRRESWLDKVHFCKGLTDQLAS